MLLRDPSHPQGMHPRCPPPLLSVDVTIQPPPAANKHPSKGYKETFWGTKWPFLVFLHPAGRWGVCVTGGTCEWVGQGISWGSETLTGKHRLSGDRGIRGQCSSRDFN